jgi:hypothetical protein
VRARREDPTVDVVASRTLRVQSFDDFSVATGSPLLCTGQEGVVSDGDQGAVLRGLPERLV